MTTKTISSSKLRSNLSDALDAIDTNDVLIVTRRGKAEKAIIDLDKLEDLLAASNPEYLASIKEARQDYKQGNVLSFEEAFGAL